MALEALHEALFRHTPDAEYVLDLTSNRFLLVNDAFLALLGCAREEMSRVSPEDLVVPEEREAFRARKVDPARPASETYLLKALRRDGTRIDIELSVHRLSLDGRPLVLGSARDITQRLRQTELGLRHQATLLELARTDNDDFEGALREITRKDAEVLSVERVSFWRYNADRSRIVCEDLFLLERGLHEKGAELKALEYPRYFRSLGSERLLAADDAVNDPRTSEFAKGYLLPLGIRSMLDVGVRLRGHLVGILCHEHTGTPRSWTAEEQAFASSVADRLALLLEAQERLATEKALRESEERFRRLSEATTEGIVLEEQGRILYANPTLAALLGCPAAEMVGKDGTAFVAPESRDLVSRIAREGADAAYEAVGLRKDGTTFQYEARSRSIPFQGRIVRVVAMRDITALKQLHASLERQVKIEKKRTLEAFQANVRIFQLTEKVRAAYESTSQLVNARDVSELAASAVRLLCDPAGLDYREARIYGLTAEGLDLLSAHPEQPQISIPRDAGHPAAKAVRTGEAQNDAAGLTLPLKGQTGAVGALEVVFHATEEVRSWQENILRTLASSLSLMFDNLNLYDVVRKQSITDALTGAYNRRFFDERLVAEVERAVRYKRELTLVMIDLDDFKDVNDDPQGGHLQGDEVLRELGALLRKESRQIDIVCRYGGDEFSLILPETGLVNGARHADRLREMIAAREFRYRQNAERSFHFTISVGVAAVGPGHQTPEAVLEAADRAAFLAKREGKNRVKVAEDP